MEKLIIPNKLPTIPVVGSDELFPVRRIYCVGRNFAAHTREMGHDPDKDKPFFFMKPADCVIMDGSTIDYPVATQNLHHEIELVAAIGIGGSNISTVNSLRHVFGYAVGLDMTRRDLQNLAKEMGRPWDVGKGFDASAPVGSLSRVSEIGHPKNERIWLKVNDVLRQDSSISNLIWSVPEIIAHLSTLFRLEGGDLIFTGTPDGVGPVEAGDTLVGGVEGLGELTIAYRK